jgi:hypothetical protein
LIAAAARLARAREIVANQHALIAKLRALGRPTEDAEKSLDPERGKLSRSFARVVLSDLRLVVQDHVQ